ncbi:MAG: hypothetical protein J1E62_02965 [Lachnospiraceae bacterium]|nr:hypothetical protein [Lachnospiraceae bacterium]
MVTTTNYSYDFYLRCIYSGNRFARKAENRLTMLPNDLVKADSSALDKISQQLRDLEYSTDNGTDVLNHAKLFVETYNNLVESSGTSDSDQVVRMQKELKKMTKEHKSELEDIGITISSNGKLNMDKKKFAESSPYKIESVLGKDSTFVSKLSTLSKKMKRTAQRSAVPPKKEESGKTANNTVAAPGSITNTPGTGIVSSTKIDVVT